MNICQDCTHLTCDPFAKLVCDARTHRHVSEYDAACDAFEPQKQQ